MTDGHQSLYRRYRSQRFGELVGQDHVVRALRNAVAHNAYGHAYLFSGPRGTGKTSTARILAKALNCPHVTDGEPCGVCDTCIAIADGTSFDVHELDAASNNGVDAMRDLIERTALATPGRTKVYILDEVHMLSKAAEAALLKTLEEPPDHVVFVLATTDPQKVSATIRSRCQPFEFHLINTGDLDRHVRYVMADAGIALGDDAIEAVLRQGAGSARDTLSALDQMAAAGGVVGQVLPLDDIVESLIARDPSAALVSLAQAAASGRDPRILAESLVAHLRDGLLSAQAPELVRLTDTAAARVADQAKRLGTAAIVRAMEVLGETLVELRHAPDPRVLLDVALIRLTNVELDTSPAALLERIERLERADRNDRAPAAGTPSTGSTPAPSTGGAAQARAVLGGMKTTARPAPGPTAAARPTAERAPAPSAAVPSAPLAESVAAVPASAAPARSPAGPLPPVDMLQVAWVDLIVERLKPATKALFRVGRFVRADERSAQFALPNQPHVNRCEAKKREVEEILAAHFGRPIPLQLVVESVTGAGTTAPSTDPHDDQLIDPTELVDARPDGTTGMDRLTAAFPGAEIINEETP